MTEGRNGTRPPTGERGVVISDRLLGGNYGLPYSVSRSGLEDFTRPSAADVQEMVARDGMAQALYFLLTFLIGDAPMHIEGEGPKADHVRANLLGNKGEGGMTTPMTTVVKQAASGIPYKRACFELVWDYRDGKNWINKIKLLPVASCRILPDKLGNYNGFVQESTQNVLSGQPPTKFPPEKSFVYFHDGALAPLEGRSALSAAWHEYNNKTKARHLTHLHLQQFALGIKHLTTKSANEDDQKSLQNRGEGVNGGGTVVTGPEETMSVLTGGSTQEFSPYLSYIDRQMGVSTLMQWLGLGGSEGSGAQSLSRDHSSFTVSQADGTLRQMADDFTRYVISDMVRYNFPAGGEGDEPELKLGPISEADKQVALDLFKTAMTAPQTRLTDSDWKQIKTKAFATMDIEPEEESEGAPQAPQAPQSAPEDEGGDAMERARKIMRGE